MRDRANTELQVLQQNSLADVKRIAAIGYCFGGGTGDDPSKGVAYNKNADERSWQAMKLFLTQVFQYT
jgi:dienelactone hydrolase